MKVSDWSFGTMALTDWFMVTISDWLMATMVSCDLVFKSSGELWLVFEKNGDLWLVFVSNSGLWLVFGSNGFCLSTKPGFPVWWFFLCHQTGINVWKMWPQHWSWRKISLVLTYLVVMHFIFFPVPQQTLRTTQAATRMQNGCHSDPECVQYIKLMWYNNNLDVTRD